MIKFDWIRYEDWQRTVREDDGQPLPYIITMDGERLTALQIITQLEAVSQLSDEIISATKREQMDQLGSQIHEVNELLEMLNQSRAGMDGGDFTTRQTWLYQLRDVLWAKVSWLAQEMVEAEDD